MIYKYITEITEKEMNEMIIIPCLNDNGFRTLLIKNLTKKRIESNYDTKHLIIKKNITLYYDNQPYFFHLISCKENTNLMNYNFDIIYEYLFKKIEEPIDESTFSELLFSIQSLFEKPSDNLTSVQIGTAGELLTALHLYKSGYKGIFNNFHKNMFSKHDIEITDSLKIEVKTTTKETRTHRFSHNQIYDNFYDIYVSSVILYKTEKGTSLYDLFVELLNITDNYETRFSLYKLMNFCGVNNMNQGIVFSKENSMKSIKIINGINLPKINNDIPEGISNISYDVYCDLARQESIGNFVKFLREQNAKNI